MKSIFTLTTLLLTTASALPFSVSPSHRGPRALATRSNCTAHAVSADAEPDTGGAGLNITNADNQTRSYFVYENGCDTVPAKYLSVDAGATKFLPLPAGFQGRVVRGTTDVNLDGSAHTLGTWVEIGLDASGTGWADVSLIRGMDGAVTIASADGSGAKTGFSENSVLDDATESILEAKPSGAMAIKATEDWQAALLSNVVSYLAGKLGYAVAYIDDYHGNPVISSSNSRFAVTFYEGRP
ncbi:uncharacterized protein F4807DRAFT_460978 [Annulohypoxylon truncatum]|uniref:uncharacterized protein n=1 Tax=Annulohypoxylon truncatum TaxID=327061 RepID=UPI002007F089|nr:uncharacterized protein F4807DRAFT_460978 [Annulohypoxylon truncatum]KAI1209287.1 hypothetical protein F4807DRAFT_460978 [Annulohypoxylon truncatum]